MDNNSTDATPEILAALAANYPTVIAAKCSRPGASAARNHGLHLARGEWIQFLDVDDKLFPNKLEKQLSAINPATQWIIGGYRNQFTDGKTTDNLPHSSPWKGLVFQYRIGCTHANLFRRIALQQVGGWNETIPDNEDPELHFKLLQAKLPYLIVSEVLCTYHHHGSHQLSKQDPAGGNARRLALLERVNEHLRVNEPGFWQENAAFFQGALLRALRVYASHDLGAAAGAYNRIFEQGWGEPPELIAPWMLQTYRTLGFQRTEQLRLTLRNWLPGGLKHRLKKYGE